MKAKLIFIICLLLCVIGTILLFVFGNKLNEIQMEIIAIYSGISFIICAIIGTIACISDE